MNSKITYRKQFTRCGKERCRKCREGEGHGPYWYAYWSEKGRTVSKYIGIHLPADVEMRQQARQARPVVLEESVELSTDGPLSPVSEPLLKVYLLGQFRVERKSNGEWKTVDNRIWHRRRVRVLLACLLSNPGRRLGREQVMELLWPDLDIDVAANRLNGAVHELRQILEPEIARPAASNMLRLEREVLELADSSQIWVDAEAFENRLKEANSATNPMQVEQLLEEAAALYGGNYLMEELYSEWAAPRRDALQRGWVGLLLTLANLRAEQGAFVSAIETLERLHPTDPTNETALQRMMVLLTQLDRRGEALQLYRQHVVLMKRDYESEPLPETRRLYEALRQGQVPMTPIVKTPPPPPVLEVKEPVSVAPVAPAPVSPAPVVQEIIFSRPAFQPGRHSQSPLVGRQRELETIHGLMRSIEDTASRLPHSVPASEEDEPSHHLPTSSTTATTKRPHFLLLTGEPGIGKTRLAEELSLEAYTRGWTVVWSRAYEQEGAIPYRPWTELLRTLLQSVLSQLEAIAGRANVVPHPLQFKLERLSALLPELVTHPSLASMRPSPPLSYEQERLHLWETTLGVLETFSQARPLLLVLDDIHWIDDSSIELLTYLAHHLQDQRILLAGTCRDGELAPVHKLRTLIADMRRELTVVPISVLPLTESQIGTLVAHLPENLVQSVQTRASGNPFFAEELARYVVATDNGETPVIPFAASVQGEGATHTYATRGSSRNKVGPEAARFQRSLPEGIAAVLDRRLHRLSNECQVLMAKAAVLGGSFELRQLLPMTYDQVEDEILDLLEEATHAGLLTEEGIGAHIIYHFWHPLIVSHLYERLSAARRAQLHRKAADAIKISHASSQQEKVAGAIVYHLSRGGGEPGHIVYYAEMAGNRAYALAAYAEVQYYYLLVIQALMEATISSVSISDSHAQIRHITPDIITAHPPGSNDLRYVCQILERIAECSMAQGNFEDGRHLYSCILTIRTGDAFRQQIYASYEDKEVRQRQEVQIQALLWRELGNTWVETGEYSHAYECYGRGKEVLSHAGVTEGIAWACLHLQYGEMHRLVGNFYEARRYLKDALIMLEQTMHQSIPALMPPSAPLVNSEPPSTRPPKEVQTRTERTLIGDPLEIGYAHERLGIVAASLGQISEALAHMHTALNIYEQNELIMEMTRVSGNLGAAYITKGDLSSARASLHRARDLAERTGATPNVTFVTGNLADVAQRSGDLLESEAWFKRSIALSEQLHDRHRIAWFSVELASVQQDLGHMQEAAENIQRALVLARDLKNPRHLQFALIGLGDLRIMEAIVAYHVRMPRTPQEQYTSHYYRLLQRAKATLQRAISLKGLEIEPMIESRLLLATVHSLLNDQETAKEIALHAMIEAQEQEVTRVIGRAQRLLGRIMAEQGRHADADYYFEQAIRLCNACELRLDYARTIHSYGFALLQRHEKATSAAQKVVQLKGQQQAQASYQQGLSYLYEAREIFATSHAAYDLTLVDLTLADIKQRQSQKMYMSEEEFL